MSYRYMCPSTGAVRRAISKNAVVLSNHCSRAFHASAWRLEEGSSSGAPPTKAATAPSAPPDSRKARSAAAFKRFGDLQSRRPFPPGPGLTGGTPMGPRSAAPPSGKMVRGPSNIQRNALGNRSRGPNLGARQREPGARRKRRAPENRDNKSGGAARSKTANKSAKDRLSDGTVLNLMRLQQKEWEKKPYEPKYAPGSFAANELIHMGRELCRGESPPVKIWGPLERKIGVVGMHNAEGELQIRRVPDGDRLPYGRGHSGRVEMPKKNEPTS